MVAMASFAIARGRFHRACGVVAALIRGTRVSTFRFEGDLERAVPIGERSILYRRFEEARGGDVSCLPCLKFYFFRCIAPPAMRLIAVSLPP
jgi:hypothetical protein